MPHTSSPAPISAHQQPSRPWYRRRSLLFLLSGVALALLLLIGGVMALPQTLWSAGSQQTAIDPAKAVTQAWEAARSRGGYHFSSDVIQVTVPEATLTNVGRTSLQEQVYLEGETDLADQSMQMTLWSDGLGGGSVLIPESGLAVQVADGKTRTRQGNGPWEESQDFTQSYAPQGDFMAYLAAMRDVTLLGAESSHGLSYTRYTFTLDGLAFARHSRDQMQRAMHARGELPGNIQLEVSAYHAQMTGDGEVWIGEDGLPLRQILRIQFPEQNDERVSAQLSTNFFDYAPPRGSMAGFFTNPGAVWGVVQGWASQQMITVVSSLLLTVLVVMAALLLIYYRRRRVVELVIALFMSLLMMVMPLLTNLPTLRFLDRQTVQAAEQEEIQAEVDMVQSLRTISRESTFDPHASRLETDAPPRTVAATTATTPLSNPKCPDLNEPDTDGDGLNDCMETEVWKTLIDNPDTDGDGIGDFQEVGLGLDPRNNDTDNDGLLDKTELSGFADPYGVWWYTDPTQMDSNGDGLSDLMERGPESSPTAAIDTDNDKSPDLFDWDNDNDGVPDATDLSPFTMAPTTGPASPYGESNPMQLTLNGIESGRMAYLDLQVRPKETEHLRYAFTVLDWPADRKGQIQDWDETTYAQHLVSRGDIANTGQAAPQDSYGDMRLTPSIEISIDAPNGVGGADLSRYNLPPQKDLLPYNINVITSTTDGTAMGTPNGIKLYVPLTLVTDPRTGTRVAFRARIPYMGTGTAWGTAHEMRMVWTVQMLQDIPCDPTNDHSYAAGCRAYDGSSTLLFNLASSNTGSLNNEEASAAVKAAFANAGRALVDPVTVTSMTPNSHWMVSDENNTYILRAKGGQIQVHASTPGVIYNQSQIVQRYEDDWFVTGANVTEDHGVDVNIIYEDPTVDRDIHSDDSLWALAYGLEDTFLTPTDSQQTNQQDFPLSEVYRRFNRETNSGNTTERWGIENVLVVEERSYDTQDWAVASVAMTTTKEVLTAFDSTYQNSGPITPTLMYAQEARYRGVGLDDARVGSTNIAISASGLAINLSPGGANTLRPTTVNSLKWTSFCAAPGSEMNNAPTWQECQQETYMGELVTRYRDYFRSPDESQTKTDGRVVTMQLYYMGLWQGVSVTSQSGGLVIKEPGTGTTDGQIALELQQANGVAGGAAKVADIVIRKMFLDVDALLETIGTSKLSVMANRNKAANTAVKKLTHAGKIEEAWSGMDYNRIKSSKIQAKALLSIAAVGFGMLATYIWPESQVAAGVSTGTALVVLNVYLGLYKPLMQAKALASVTSWGAVLKGNSALAGTSSRATAIGTAVVIAIAWGVFIGSMLESGTKFGSPAFNAGLAAVLALTIYLVFLAVLSASVVGLLIVGLLAAIDGLFSFLCAVSGDAKDALGNKDGDCTVGTKIVTALTGYLYARDMIIELDAEKNPKLVDQAAPITVLRNPGWGYKDSNLIDFSVPVTTNILHKDPDNWNVIPYISNFYNESNFRSSTFKYTVSQQKAAFEVDRYGMSNEWTGMTYENTSDYGVSWTKLRAYAYQEPAMVVDLAPGINQPIDYWFNMAYAIPAYECWTIIYVPVCEVETERGGDPSFVNGPSFDIFPDTLSEFFALANSPGGGYRLNWDTGFPTIWDADGDGLVSGARNGIDPDDNNPDMDYDGLTDRFEMERRMQGTRLSADDPDTDSDTLTDGQEIQFGTNPNNRDTDNDGLTDAEEIRHQVYKLEGEEMVLQLDNAGNPQMAGGWIVCAPQSGRSDVCAWVSSDPLNGDGDEDGIPDDAERRLYELYKVDEAGLPYHPNVANVNPLKLFTSASVAPTDYVKPGASIVYTNTMVSYVDLDPAVLDLMPPAIVGGSREAVEITFSPNSTRTVARSYQVAADASSQSVEIKSALRARLASQNANMTSEFITSDGANRSDFVAPFYARAVSSTPKRPDDPESYLLGGLAATNSVRGSKGNIYSYELNGGPSVPLDKDSEGVNGTVESQYFRRGTSAPGISCNDAGTCFEVWDHVDNCTTFSVYYLGVNFDFDDGGSGYEPVLYYYDDGVADDPSTGRVLWSADEYYLDMEGGDWAGGALGAPVHRGLPEYRTFCNPQDPGTGYAAIDVWESDGNFREGDTISGSADIFPTPARILIHPSQMGARTVPIGNFPVIGHSLNVSVNVPKKQRNTIVGSSTSQSTQFALTQSLGESGENVGDFNPVVASDGEGWIVVWNRKIATYSAPNWTITSKMMYRRFDANRTPIGPVTEIWSRNYTFDGTIDYNTWDFVNYDAGFARTQADLIPNVVWAGDRYRVVWSLPDSSAILYQDVFANSAGDVGVLVGSNIQPYQYSRIVEPAIAYDPVNNQILTVYHSADDKIAGRLFHLNSGLTTELPSLVFKQPGTVPKPTIAYYPAIQGWMLSFIYYGSSMNFSALASDGSPYNNPILYTWPSGSQARMPSGQTLSCPSPLSAPVVALPFEEMPGATSFADVSGTGAANASCSGASCPLVGVAGVGVPRAELANETARPPRTDRAIFFDGIDDYVRFDSPTEDAFTYSFWFRPDPSQVHVGQNWYEGTPLLLANSNDFNTLYGVSIGEGNTIMIGQGSASIKTQPIPAEEWDTWHHVVLLRRPSNDNIVLYLDGQGVVGVENPTAPVSNPEVLLGIYNTRFFRGSVDFLTVYNTDLKGDTILEMYEGERKSDLGYSLNPSTCVMAGAVYDNTSSGFAWTKIAVQKTLPRGEGPLTAQDGVRFNVDSVRPTSSIDSLPDSISYVRAGTPTRAGLSMETLIIGGTATDADSGVSHVDITINNSTAYSATGQATWTFPLTFGGEGRYIVRSEAVDYAGWRQSGGAQVTLYADGGGPDITLADQQLVPRRNMDGRWSFEIRGQIDDPGIDDNAYNGSGVDPASVRVILQMADGTEVANHPATVTGNSWSAEVEMTSAIGDPTGVYTATVTAADVVGNPSSTTARVDLSVSSVEAETDQESIVLDYIVGSSAASSARMGSQTPDLSGVLTSTKGLASGSSVQGTFIPIAQTLVLSDSVMILGLDEPIGSVWFPDATLHANSAFCDTQRDCPVAGEDGRRDGALSFNGTAAVGVANAPSIDFDASENFTLMLWVKATGGNYPILISKYGLDGSYHLGLDETGRVYFEMNNTEIVKSAGGIFDNEWNHIAVSIDRNGERILYINGRESDYDPSDTFLESVSNPSGLDIGYGLEGWMDDIIIVDRALSTSEVRTVMNMADEVWLPASFTRTSGSTDGPIAGTWTLPVPADMENLYQLDLRVTDATGRRLRRSNLWRGVIDTQAPRLSMDAEATGNLYVDPASGDPRYEIRFNSVVAKDQNLDLNSFTTACGPDAPVTRGYINETWNNLLFPDLTLRDTLTVQCHLWVSQANPVFETAACDTYGQCTTISETVNTAGVTRRADNTADPILVWPPAGSVIPMGQAVEFQLGAASASALKELGIMVNGTPAEMVTFTQGEDVKNTVATVTFNLPAAGEGVYNMSVRSTAWDGTVEEGAVSQIILDTGDPVGNLITEVIGEEGTYGANGGLLRLSGGAGDGLGNDNVATVQVSVDGGPWQDVTWNGDGTWVAAVYVGPAPYGKRFDVTMRTIDKAGRISTDTKSVLADIPIPEGYDPAQLPTLSVVDAAASEGAGTLSFVLTLSEAQETGTVAVNYTTAAGTAGADDFTARSGVALIRAGQASTMVTVPIKEDSLDEGNETMILRLSAPVNATLARNEGTGIINDNDGEPDPTATPTRTPIPPTATPTSTPVTPNAPTHTPTPTRPPATSTPTPTATVPAATPTATPTVGSATPTPTATPDDFTVFMPSINQQLAGREDANSGGINTGEYLLYLPMME